MSSEVDRLVALGDVDAILDELHQYRTEWDDAREALDRLVGKAASEASAKVERLRATPRDWERKADSLTEQRDTAMAARDKARAEVQRLRGDVRELAVLRRDMGAVQAERDKALDDAGTSRDRTAQESARAQAAEGEVKRLRASLSLARGIERDRDRLLDERRNERVLRRKAEAERDRLAEQLDGADGRVLRALTGVDERGELHALTAAELAEVVMTAIRGEGEEETRG